MYFIHTDSDVLEVIPTKEYLLNEKVIRVKVEHKDVVNSIPSKASAEWSIDPVYFFPTTAIVLAAFFHYLMKKDISTNDILSMQFDTITNLFNMKKVGECVAALLSWGLPYLFIRRLMNPETSRTAIAKYAYDAFFGGLAAIGTIIIRSYVIAIFSKLGY